MRTKNCVICNTEFEPYVPHAKFCSNTCRNTNVRNVRKLKADTLPKKKCLFCNEEVNRPRKYKYCSDKCHKAMNCKKVCDRAKKKVRENHDKKPPKYCKTCNVELITTVRNHHVLEFCPPCRKLQDEKRKADFYEENKERLTAKGKENHAKRMQDPEYKKKWNQKSKARRDANPVMVNCQNCGKEFRRIKYNRNCSEKCSQEWVNKQRQRPVSRLSGRLACAMRRVLSGRRNRDNIWKYFDFSVDKLKEHLESQFTCDMSWDNMNEWHIDHIRPKASFCQVSLLDTNSEDFKKCWALNNLQPLWAKDNIRKSNKWDGVVNA